MFARKIIIKSFTAIILMALPLFAPAPSKAAIFEDSLYFSGIPNLTEILVFDQFNPAWGTVNSIIVSLTLYAQGGALRVDNDSGSPAVSDVSFGASASLSAGGGILLDGSFNSIPGTVIAATTASLSLGADDGDAEVGGTSNFSNQGPDFGQVIGQTTSNSASGSVGAFFMNGYVGVGTYSITVHANQYVQLGSLGGAQQQIDPLSVSGTVTVTYDYTGDGPPQPQPPPPENSNAVPEPTAIILIATALVSLRMFRTRV